MSEGYIVRRGGGGGKVPFAFLIVNYPSGADLSCTNVESKYKQLVDSGDVYQRLYYVKEAGTCTATISQSGYTSKSDSVTFTSAEEGTSKTVTLAFSYSLMPITGASSFWAFSKQDNMSAPTITDDSITISFGGGSTKGNCILYTNTELVLTGYTTLNIEYAVTNTHGNNTSRNVEFGLTATGSTPTTTNYAFAVSKSNERMAVGTYTDSIDISEYISDVHRVAVKFGYCSGTINKVWLS